MLHSADTRQSFGLFFFMEFCWCADTVLFVISALLVLLHVGLRVRSNVRVSRWCCGCMDAFEPLKRCLLAWVQYFWDALISKKSTHDELVERKILQRRIEAIGIASITAANILALVLLVNVFRGATEQVIHSTAPQRTCLVVAMLASMCVYSAPALTSRSIDVYYALMIIATSVYIWTSSIELLALSMVQAAFVRLMLSVLYLKTAATILWNTMLSGATCVYLANCSVNDELKSILAYSDVGSTIVLIIVAAGVKRLATSVAHQEVCISRLRTENSSSMLLLDMVCDVILELSDKLRIVHDSPAFTALLMRAAGSSNEGMSFTSFIHDKDEAQDFQDSLFGKRCFEGKVGTGVATLSDTSRNTVRVEMFFVRIEMDTNINHYLLGIREFKDSEVIQGPSFKAPKQKGVKPLLNNGTPSALERSTLGKPSGSDKGKTSGRCRYPHLQLTNEKGMYSSLGMSLSTWNISTMRTTCCSYHEYITAGKTALTKLAEAPCDSNFPEIVQQGRQCQECGIIDASIEQSEVTACSVCLSPDMTFFDMNAAGISDSESLQGSEAASGRTAL
eukprot:TRINITY_DN23808_c0_g2_i1.p1 TRINITY_DN23808_c0_g2~~TRINITY_DN23808_c0_g2_i1.p1  ORF type:complete len:563 (-),score=41.40 TRINITY_DN23808_c0_g2_i1:320-2008(-)